MALREVLKFPDKRLRLVSAPVTEITEEVRKLASDMCEVMYDEPGIGLAAPQVGEAIRLIVVDTDWNSDEDDSGRQPLILVNPEIYEREDKVIWNEGCLSVPDFEADVERSAKVRLRATDLDGNDLDLYAEELQAVCFQHEVDHLNGVLFIDHISRLKRSMYVKRRQKQVRRELEESGDAS
jgi:peptide deformylase